MNADFHEDDDIRVFREEYPDAYEFVMKVLDGDCDEPISQAFKDDYGEAVLNDFLKILTRRATSKDIQAFQGEYPDIYKALEKLLNKQATYHQSPIGQSSIKAPFKKGDYIGQTYWIYDVIGEGGFGVVYLVYLPNIKLHFALKTFRDEYYLEDEHARDLFRKEAAFVQEYRESGLHAGEERETPSFDFIQKKELIPILARDYIEVATCIESACWKSAIILCGSVIEAILYDLLKENEPAALSSKAAQKYKGDVSPLEVWKLNSLINAASELSLITKGVEGLSHSAREFRNLIHPLKAISEVYKIEKEEEENAFTTLKILIRDLA